MAIRKKLKYEVDYFVDPKYISLPEILEKFGIKLHDIPAWAIKHPYYYGDGLRRYIDNENSGFISQLDIQMHSWFLKKTIFDHLKLVKCICTKVPMTAHKYGEEKDDIYNAITCQDQDLELDKVYTALNPLLKTYYYQKKNTTMQDCVASMSPYEEMQIYINGKWMKKLIGRFEFLEEI